MTYLILAVGLGILLGGGELMVRGAVGVARHLQVSPMVIGLTLVGFGTSMPELVACVDAALRGAPALALGNVIGSNIANVLLIMGIAAALMPMATDRKAFARDGPALIGASLLLVLVCQLDVIGRAFGAGALALLIAYTFYTYRSERRRPESGVATEQELAALGRLAGRPWLAAGVGAVGLAGVLLGAELLVRAAIDLARLWDVSEATIGLTVVAIGTSLPELATAAVAAWRRQPDVAFGNIVGSNIFNSLGILGTTALVTPIPVPPEIARFDVWVMLGVIAFLVGFAATDWRVSRPEGLALLTAYAAYLVVVF